MHMLKTGVLACAVALAGCGAITRTTYEAPQVALPAQFEHAQPSAAAPSPEAWWRAFGDPRLDAWIDMALARNPDLATAGIRVRRAALQAQLAGRALLPQPGGTLSTGASRPLSGSPRSTLETSSATLSVGWELDLFDRLGAQRDAAVFEAQASEQDRQAVALSLAATTASLYWQLALANERLEFARQSLEYTRRTGELVEAQYRSGAVSSLERREARQALAEQQALLSQYTQARAELRQALNELLLGAEAPGGEPQALPTGALPAIAAGLPAELLGRRPDLRAAELRLRASLASSDAATARYYPTLSLTGSLGGSSNSLLDLLANPVAALGASMTLPFLNVGEMRLNTAIARNQHEEAVVNFRKSLYAALAETEKALSARTELASQEQAQQRVMQESAEITRLYEARYRAGQVPLRTWLDAQERSRNAQLALSALHLAQLQNQVTINKVLGGGWQAP
ncbi:efflux transporter outer membrane subunit [Delftia sp. DS1230]|uniref:efflux transporter outer membrane subunit n=1 Tax=Delftia sp. DS1230 TaxID=3153805 RepID=UPI0032D8E0B5